MQKVRVRFAPSPTGHLHIGGARAGIFNWLFARNVGGKFLVRIEDTDLERSKKEYVDSILDSLEWLDLVSDEPIVYQSSRVSEYKKIIDVLLEKGLAYKCFCEPKEYSKSSDSFYSKYSGKCRNLDNKDIENKNSKYAVRFKLPKDIKEVTFFDEIRGDITISIDQLDDFVIWRRDNMPTYNFCVVIDDIYMKISHVIRGEDHISNTPKQILLYNALDAKLPVFAHLPLILGQGGHKLSKRDAAVSVIEYKKQGFLPRALFNYLVRLGWSHGDQEVFDKQEIIEGFALKNVSKHGAIFDMKKLSWLNGVYLRKLDYNSFLELLSNGNIDKLKTLTTTWKDSILRKLFELYKDRATVLFEIVDDIIALKKVPTEFNLVLIEKWLNNKTGFVLKEFLDLSEKLEFYDHKSIIRIARDICKKFDIKLVSLAQPLRLALVGKVCSPGVFELMEVLGPQEVYKRVTDLIVIIDNK